MAAISLEQFDTALAEFGTRRDTARISSRLGRLAERFTKLRNTATDEPVVEDIFDASSVIETPKGTEQMPYIEVDTELLSRWFVPMAQRAAVLARLETEGIGAADLYGETGAAGNKWYRVNAGGDPEAFRSCYMMRTLLDETPPEGGTVLVDPAKLHTALTGEEA